MERNSSSEGLARENWHLQLPAISRPRARGADDCPGGQRLRGYRVSRRYRSGYVRVAGRQAGRIGGRGWVRPRVVAGRVRVTESYIYREKGKLGSALQSTQPPRLQWCAFGSLIRHTHSSRLRARGNSPIHVSTRSTRSQRQNLPGKRPPAFSSPHVSSACQRPP